MEERHNFLLGLLDGNPRIENSRGKQRVKVVDAKLFSTITFAAWGEGWS
jgi:hypothetical protein